MMSALCKRDPRWMLRYSVIDADLKALGTFKCCLETILRPRGKNNSEESNIPFS
jgi:hypothetical protein